MRLVSSGHKFKTEAIRKTALQPHITSHPFISHHMATHMAQSTCTGQTHDHRPWEDLHHARVIY